METEPKKVRTKGGRPRLHTSTEKRPVMAFRIRGGMHEKLIASAKTREVSLSEEIEFRLEQSFKEGAEPYMDTALRMAAANCMVVQDLTGETIASDPYTRTACAKAAATAIELVGGLAGRDTPETRALLQTDAEAFGQIVGMFTRALYDGAPADAVDGLKAMVEAMTERRRLEIAEKDLRNRTALARLLREGAPAQVAPEPTAEE